MYDVCLLWVNLYVGLRETMEGSGFLAQASVSRLGEICSNSLMLVARAVAQATSSCFERKSISLRRGGLAQARECVSHYSTLLELSPRRRELA